MGGDKGVCVVLVQPHLEEIVSPDIPDVVVTLTQGLLFPCKLGFSVKRALLVDFGTIELLVSWHSVLMEELVFIGGLSVHVVQ